MSRRKKKNPGELAVILLGVLVSGAAVAGLLLYGHSRAKTNVPKAPDLPGKAPDGSPLSNVGAFPVLKVGDVILVNSSAARLPAPVDGQVSMVVDMILSDATAVSARLADARFPLVTFSGTIPRSSIVKLLIPAGELIT